MKIKFHNSLCLKGKKIVSCLPGFGKSGPFAIVKRNPSHNRMISETVIATECSYLWYYRENPRDSLRTDLIKI